MSIGNVIRELRRSRMLTAPELAKRSGMSRGHLHQVENQKYAPSLHTLERLSAALGVGVARLLSLKSPEIVLEDAFIQQLRPFLRYLNSRQRELLLRTLHAAPKAGRPL